MFKLKILVWALKLFIAINCICILSSIYMAYRFKYDISMPPPPSGMYTSMFIKNICMIFLISGLLYLHRSFRIFIDEGYFNSKSAAYLSKSGYFFIANSILSYFTLLINGMFYEIEKMGSEHLPYLTGLVNGFTSNAVLAVIGLALIAASDIIKNGEYIKLDNDLTI